MDGLDDSIALLPPAGRETRSRGTSCSRRQRNAWHLIPQMDPLPGARWESCTGGVMAFIRGVTWSERDAPALYHGRGPARPCESQASSSDW